MNKPEFERILIKVKNNFQKEKDQYKKNNYEEFGSDKFQAGFIRGFETVEGILLNVICDLMANFKDY